MGVICIKIVVFDTSKVMLFIKSVDVHDCGKGGLLLEADDSLKG